MPLFYFKSPMQTFFSWCLFLFTVFVNACAYAHPYPVGYQDQVWVNKALCPDPSAPNDSKACRRIMVRMYYPAQAQQVSPVSTYPQWVIARFLQPIKGHVSDKQYQDITRHLAAIKLPAGKALPVSKHTFPVILFSPGAIDNAEEYSKLLINLASHGYVVVAINDTYLTTVQFPNGQLMPANSIFQQVAHLPALYQLKYLDMAFALKHVLTMHCQSKRAGRSVACAMNKHKIGVLGHSGGASAVIAMAHQHPKLIQAAVALDAPNQTDPKTNLNLAKAKVHFASMFNVFSEFDVPMLQMHSSYARFFLGTPQAEFHLLPHNYLVTIRRGHHGYFKHMDYSDYALFRDMPVLLPWQQLLFPSVLYGSVSGHRAALVVSTYIVAFFNRFLKRHVNQAWSRCMPLTQDTQIQCGH